MLCNRIQKMVAAISCFVLFGIITVTTGNPVRNNREDSFQEEDEFQFQRLLQSLADAYNEEASKDYLDSRAKWTKPRQVFNEVKPQQFYKLYGKEDEDQLNVNDVNKIYQFLKQNGDKADNNVAKKLIDELLTLDGKGNYKQSKPDENDDEVFDLYGNLKKSSADSYRVIGNVHGNNLKSKNILPDYEMFKSRNGNSYGTYNVRNYKNNNNKRLRDERDRKDIDSKLAAQTIKVNDELDAVILGLSDVDDLLTKLNVRKPNEPKYKVRGTNSAKLLQNIDLQNLFTNFDKNNVEAAVFDLTQVENGDALAKQIKRLLTQSSEAAYDYEDYGNLVEKHLKQGIYDLKKEAVSSRGTPIIMPHNENNNNVYMPKWLLTEIVRSYAKETPVEEQSLFPLAKQQKAKRNKARNQKTPRIFRRNGEQDVGIPFHLEVQGLGQVNP